MKKINIRFYITIAMSSTHSHLDVPSGRIISEDRKAVHRVIVEDVVTIEGRSFTDVTAMIVDPTHSSKKVHETNAASHAFEIESAAKFLTGEEKEKQTPQSATLKIQKGHALDPFELGPQDKHYGYRVRLYNKHGFCLNILPRGRIQTDNTGSDKYGVLEFSSAGMGEVRIRGVQANLYLAMNKNGYLYGEEDPREMGTVFIEGQAGQYTTYLSQKYAHRGWYVGIKKTGIIKHASRTNWGQKAVQFLAIRLQHQQ